MAEKQPLRNLARATALRRLHLLLTALRFESGAEHTGGAAHRRRRFGRRNQGRGGNVGHGYRPHAGKVKPPQKRARTQLAGPPDIDEKLHQRISQLGEFARKLVGLRNLVGIRFAGQETQALVAEIMEEVVEGGGQALIFLLAVNSLGAPHGQRDTHHLSRFFLPQVACEFREVGQAVGAREQNIHRKADAQNFRNFP